MYFTHHFAHQESLVRVRSWLAELGLKPEQIHLLQGGFPGLTIALEPDWLPVVRLLINAVEGSDPDGFPSFWDESKPAHELPRVFEDATPATPHRRLSAVIGWHPADPVLPADPQLSLIREAMSR